MPGIYRDLVQTLSNQNWIGVVNLKEFIFLAACITFVKLRHLWITFQSPFFVLQERLHYETLSQHLGKLGEDAGKMVHRVIDLTRPEDLDGEHLHCFFFFFFALYFFPCSAFSSILLLVCWIWLAFFLNCWPPYFWMLIILVIQKCMQMHKRLERKWKARGI